MEQTIRPRDDTNFDYDKNKNIKLIKSLFENLANEILYQIFEYLDFYYVYNGFFDINKRFQDLLLSSTIPIKINTPNVSKSNFERYYENMIIPNKHRINLLCLSNPFTADIILSSPCIMSDFVRLETLILDNITAKNLYKIFLELMFLPNLHTLVLNPAEYVENATDIFSKIVRLSKLKYCKIKYQIKIDDDPLPNYFNDCDYSSVEHLIIDARFSYGSLNSLLYCFPKLRRLSIDCLVYSRYEDNESCPIRLLKSLKHVSLKLNLIKFNKFEKIAQYFFRYVEVLRISTHYDAAYLDAKQWENLITSYMPSLRVFDIHYDGFGSVNGLTYHNLIDRFTSPFWITKQWFFTHQHN
ncbi:unnamed protein product [Rotaria magnacalcarata]|uniref:F-box domain-containing protein n=1 Tax=Rotaria magnacalcarata TaxID=392030 RepID=A0A816U741_9BILA|nr:unnamed protein product [Rotaria magnacalcarata]CAF2107343.1 unnamed protein product [Rotaria magnacalcarata]CAF4200995.1 unnamed protein product [Rotaria magnacalcarata]